MGIPASTVTTSLGLKVHTNALAMNNHHPSWHHPYTILVHMYLPNKPYHTVNHMALYVVRILVYIYGLMPC